MNIERKLEEIRRALERIEAVVSSLDEKAKTAFDVFKIIRGMDLIPELNLEKAFRKGSKG